MIEHMTCQNCGYPTTPGPDGSRWCSIYGTHGTPAIDRASRLLIACVDELESTQRGLPGGRRRLKAVG